ncbi:MAG: hypothetical protein AVDCRST_MAG66-1608 [uncultured Pseudonocardia sp.]|uniref:Uncharacterized protein n=1 Tax=uncultured Pseudonocardia sp. TaxID=211455 RepID=A0A6J4P6H8_9PSEU|nr:MAG: hypothetical protein AVDCRST_MAG66-1608 [uncultured Pseudonocardia sp.]
MTGDNNDVWEVVGDEQRLALNQPVRCWTLRTSLPIDTTGTFWNRARNLGKITLQHTDLCVVRDVDGASKLTNGTPITEFDPQGQLRVTGWQPPARPSVSIANTDGVLVFNPSGPGGTGISHFELTGNQATMSVQIQITGTINLGIPLTQGLFVGLNKTFTKDYNITADDLGAPR